MHVGNVPGHRTASHGCIRLKKDTAVQLFSILDLGSPVKVDSFAPALGGPLGTDSVVVAEVTAKPRSRPRPKSKPKAPTAPVAEQPVQVAANEPQTGVPPNEVSTATEPAPAASAAESVVDLIVAPATTAPASAEPPAPAPAPAEPAAVAPPAAP
jgi:hypothetical protein